MIIIIIVFFFYFKEKKTPWLLVWKKPEKLLMVNRKCYKILKDFLLLFFMK